MAVAFHSIILIKLRQAETIKVQNGKLIQLKNKPLHIVINATAVRENAERISAAKRGAIKAKTPKRTKLYTCPP